MVNKRDIGQPHLVMFSYYRSNKSKQIETVAIQNDKNRCNAKWPTINCCHTRWPEQTETIAMAEANKQKSKLQLAKYLKILGQVISPTKWPKLSGADSNPKWYNQTLKTISIDKRTTLNKITNKQYWQIKRVVLSIIFKHGEPLKSISNDL